MNGFRDHHPEFMRTLRQSARQRAATRRVKQRRPPWSGRRWIPDWAAVLALLVVVVFSLNRRHAGAASLSSEGTEAVLALLALFLASTTERHLTEMLGHGPDLAAALHLPTDNRWITQRQTRRGLEPFPLMLGGLFLTALVVATAWPPTWGSLFGAVVFSILLGATVLSLAFWLAATRLAPFLALALWTLLIGLWLGISFQPAIKTWLVASLNEHGHWITLVLPTGWVIRPFHRGLEFGLSADWLCLLPAVVLIASLRSAWLNLQHRVRPRDQALLLHASQIPDDASEEFRREVNEALTLPASRPPEPLRAEVLSRRFLDLPRPPPPWIERWLWRCWTPAERVLAELAFPGPTRWSNSFALGSGLLLLALTLAAWGSRWGSGWVLAGWIATGVLLVHWITPISPALGRLENAWNVGQGTVTTLGLFPLGLSEVSRWALKTGRLRLLLGAPVALLAGGAVGWIHPQVVTPRTGAECAAVALIALAGLQPLWLTGNLIGRGFPRFVGRARFLHDAIWLSAGLAWLGLGVLAVLATAAAGLGWGVGLASAAMAAGSGGLAWIIRAFNRGQVELVYPPRTTDLTVWPR